MDGQGIAAVIGAICGGAATLIAAIFLQRRLNKKQSTKNFQILFNELRKDINRLRDEQAAERSQWAEERRRFNEKIDALQEIIRSQDQAMYAKDIEVTELRGKVNLLQTQLDTYREVQTKNVTIKT